MHYCHCSTGLLTFMRFLHTSDLHLGRSLYGVNRDETFEKFLVWLTETIRTEAIDCLIIAGDVFDNATPSHRMQRAYYRFLASVATSTDCCHVIITGGNHDSPSLLNAPDTLLEALNITVVGQATADPADEVVLLRDEDGKPIAVVAAVPYLRERDLRTSTENETQQDKEEKIRSATAEHYRRVTQTALGLRGESDIPYIATGHLFAADGDPSDEERNLYIGSLGLIPASAFPTEIDYLALGHLHKAQHLAEDDTRRYCGSPLALDFSERKAAKSVCIVETQGKACTVRSLEVPAFDMLVQITGNETTVTEELIALVAAGSPVLCEVLHTEGTFAPDLAAKCRDIVQNSAVTLVRVVSLTVAAAQLSVNDVVSDVEPISPEKMFALCLQKQEACGTEFSEELKKELTDAYDEILAIVRNEGEPT